MGGLPELCYCCRSAPATRASEGAPHFRMRELASSGAEPADAVSDTVEETGVDVAAPVANVLVGGPGVAAGLLGSVLVAVTTVATRWLEVPFLYTRSRDATLHLALEVACGAALWLLPWALLNGTLQLENRLVEHVRRPARITVLLASGTAMGLLVYYFVVRVSLRSAALPAGVWIALLGVGGAALSVASEAALRIRVRARRARTVGFLMLGAALGLHVFALARYVRHYGNLQTIVLVCVASLTSLGTGLVVGVPRLQGRMGRMGWGALATSVLWIAMLGAQPSYSTRRAVLVWGGVAKRTLLSAVWPLCDRDSDGTPASFWGVDPDDRRADLTPRTSAPPSHRAEAPPLDARVALGPRHNLLWITVDTVRRDSFDRALAEDPALAKAFTGFADHKSYVSCSSRTVEAVGQLIGARRCDPRVAAGLSGHSLLEILRNAGYHDRLVGMLDSGLSFQQRELYKDDPPTFARARALLREAGDGTALFVHLRGGHGDYLAPGRTERERYENQLHASLTGVARLLEDAPTDRWAVVVVGDHGEAFGEHVSLGHATTLYEEALRTPLLVRGPSLAAGARDRRVSCDSVAWFALHAMGLIDREPAPLPDQYAVLNVAPGELGHLQGDRSRALRVGSHKVIWSSDLGLFELYDLETDPGELHSLAESRPGDLAPLRAKLEELDRDCPGP